MQTADTQATTGSQVSGTGQAPQYEFSAEQNAPIAELARKMRIVGLLLVVSGVLQCATVLAGQFAGLIGGLVSVVLGAWTCNAAASFQQIVDTQGQDISQLMGALGDLLKMYRLQYVLLVVALVLLAVAAVVFAMASASR